MKHFIFTKKTVLLILTLLFIKSQQINAQGGPSPNWQININGGSSIFFGDIKQYNIWPISNYENEWRMGAGLTFSRQFSPVIGVRGQGLIGQLSGTRRSWNRYFENDYIEFNLNTTVNINNLFGEKRDDRFMNFYLTAGIGLLNYNTTLYTLDTKKKVANVGNGNGKGIGGRTLEGILMGGIGIDFRLNDKWSVNLESANRIMNSDMQDAWVSGFPYDVYNYTSVGFSYRFGIKNRKRGTMGVSTYQREVPQEEYEVTPKQAEPEKEIYIPENEPVQVPTPVEPPKEKPVEVLVQPKPQPEKTEPEVVVVNKEPVYNKDFEYRVQIRARYNRAISKTYLSAKYNIPASEIKEDIHNGYYIYTVGSFDTYEQAKEERNRLRNYNGITDAFVVAFKNGERLDKLP